MKNYYRVMLGGKSIHLKAALEGNFIGTDYLHSHDLTGKLPEEWRTFNKVFVPIYLERRPDKTKIAAGLACGYLFTVSKGIKIGDIVITPDGTGRYRVAEVTGDYYYEPKGVLEHRRPVRWLEQTIERAEMTDALKKSCGSPGTVCNLSRAGFHEEVEKLLGGIRIPTLIATDENIEDPSEFAMEKHLEDFLVQNWAQTELGRDYDIFQEEGELAGQQYPTDTGPLDILAISKDKKRLLVVELKKGRASDVVVGQVLRYMGYVQEELAEDGQTVVGVIIAQEDDQRIRRALTMTPSISFYRYQVSFKLVRA